MVNIPLKARSGLFKDKATAILRELLASPGRQWSVRELSLASKTSVGLVSKIINILKDIDMVECGGLGVKGYTVLKDRDGLVNLWRDSYDFSFNSVVSYYSPEQTGAKQAISYLKRKNIFHAVTLHAGANLLTNYFVHDHCYIYVVVEDVEDLAIDISATVPLKRLVKGGNIHFVSPYYKSSFCNRMKNLKNMNVVSNLQLYLDLYHFMPRGQEQAEYLKQMLGDRFYE